jgi:hypothetical protein
MLSWSWRSIKLLLLHLVGFLYYFTYIDDARSNTNQVDIDYVRFIERLFTLCSSDAGLADWLRLATRKTYECTVQAWVLSIYQLQPNGDVLPTEYLNLFNSMTLLQLTIFLFVISLFIYFQSERLRNNDLKHTLRKMSGHWNVAYLTLGWSVLAYGTKICDALTVDNK